MNPPRNKIIPLEVANVIIDKYDTTLNLLEESTEIYGKALDGKGTIEYKNGNSYEGEFTNGMLHGIGTFYWKNGVKYSGGFQNNKIFGQGRYDWPDGSWYEGDVRLGLRHGRGKYVTADDCIYEGEWKDGLKHGKGIITYKSGSVYEGEFERGLKHGFGKITYPSGNYYEGEWTFDKKGGQGTMCWVDAGEKYTGSWKENKQDGWGEHLWLEDKSDGKFLRNRYEGEWQNGLRHGIGVFYYGNGSKYEGEWAENLKEGFAVFTYEDGKVFKGLYKNDKMIPNKEFPKSGEFDFTNSQTGNQGTVEEESVLKKQGTTLSVINENQPTVKRTGKRQTSTAPEKPGETKEVSLGTNEIQANPYDTLLDISDLFVEEDIDQANAEIQEVKNLLLRYHSNMKLWYRNYCSKQQIDSEESFALTTKMFWKMLRDSKVLSPKVTIAAFNRLFMQGAKNNFPLHVPRLTLKKNLFLAKRNFLESLSEAEKENIELEIHPIPEEELFHIDKKNDIHDENKILFFRHFVDGLVRVAYLKYGGFPNFAKKVEEVLITIQNSQEKRKKPKHQIEEENLLVRVRIMTENFKERLKFLFKRFPAKSQAMQFETIDYTLTVKKIIELFEICGIINEAEDKELVLHVSERTFDTDDCFVMMETPKEKAATSQRNSSERMEKLGDLLTTEVVFLEFYDIFLLSLFLKDGIVLKEDEVKKRTNNALKILEEYANENEAETRDIIERGPEIQWPYSQKDYMFEHLTVEKEKREREIALLKQKRLERETEEKEGKAMEKEDFDINDDYLRPLTKQSQIESDGFAESYNDF